MSSFAEAASAMGIKAYTAQVEKLMEADPLMNITQARSQRGREANASRQIKDDRVLCEIEDCKNVVKSFNHTLCYSPTHTGAGEQETQE